MLDIFSIRYKLFSNESGNPLGKALVTRANGHNIRFRLEMIDGAMSDMSDAFCKAFRSRIYQMLRNYYSDAPDHQTKFPIRYNQDYCLEIMLDMPNETSGNIILNDYEASQKMAYIEQIIRERSGLEFNAEFNNTLVLTVARPLDEIQITFGLANETFGASVTNHKGEAITGQYDYIETGLDFNESAAELAETIIDETRKWLAIHGGDVGELYITGNEKTAIEALRKEADNDDLSSEDNGSSKPETLYEMFSDDELANRVHELFAGGRGFDGATLADILKALAKNVRAYSNLVRESDLHETPDIADLGERLCLSFAYRLELMSKVAVLIDA
jgi:hypothetical protein